MTGTNEQRARELLASCLSDWGYPTEAENVLAGDDLDSYETDFRLIRKLRDFGLLRYPGEALAEPKAGAVPEQYDEGPTWTHAGMRITAVCEDDGRIGLVVTRDGKVEFVGKAVPNPAAPQAKPGDAYRKAVDQGRVVAHLGTAEATDDDETAVRKLGELIDWHIAVATDPAVNGGFKLVPVAGEAEQQGQAVAWVLRRKSEGHPNFAPGDYSWMDLHEGAECHFHEDENWRPVPLYTRPQPAAVDAVPRWRPITEAPADRLCVVAWNDHDDPDHPERHDFDYIEDGRWLRHDENVEHAESVAPTGSQMPQRDPPYQWFIELPDVPAALSVQGREGEAG